MSYNFGARRKINMKTVIASAAIPAGSISSPELRDFKRLLLPKCNSLDTPLSLHTDMLIFMLGRRLVTSEEYYKENISLFKVPGKDLTVHLSRPGPSREYPHTPSLNALALGGCLYARVSSLSREVYSAATDAGLRIVDVKQGYPACTVLPLGEGAAITSDGGMAEALAREGIDVTHIENSDKIKLPPYEYGFIGGCAGTYRGKVYFIGNLAAHPECAKIEQAIERAGLRAISLDKTAECLFDLGGLRFYD